MEKGDFREDPLRGLSPVQKPAHSFKDISALEDSLRSFCRVAVKKGLFKKKPKPKVELEI